MATCTSCGSDVTGKKFCANCGQAVNSGYSGTGASSNVCPRCHGDINPGAAFCMHCGSSLSAQPAAAGPIRCSQCGRQNDPGTKFCNGCGKSLTATQPAQTYYPTQAPAPYGHAQTPQAQQQVHQSQVPAPYGHAQAPQPHQQAQAPAPYGHAQAPQVQVHVHQQPGQSQYPAPYGQQPYAPPAGYQPQPMLGHNAVVIHCPSCGTVNSPGTLACYRCRTGLAGIHSAHMPIHHGYHGYHHGYHRRRDSGWLGGGGSGNLLLAGGAGLVGGMVLGEVLEDFFD